jgi:hypothetical protein
MIPAGQTQLLGEIYVPVPLHLPKVPIWFVVGLKKGGIGKGRGIFRGV